MIVSSLKTLDNLPLVKSTLNNRRGSIDPNLLYDCKMPNILKLQHEKNMLCFLKGRDLSHIVSVESSPSLVDNINNIIFEDSSLNRSCGSANMTKLDYLSLQQRNKNITKSVLISALSIACITAVKENRKRRQKLPEAGVMDFKPINSNQGLINKTLTPICKTIGYVDGTVRGYSELLKHKLKNRKGHTKVKSIINETFTQLQESPRVGARSPYQWDFKKSCVSPVKTVFLRLKSYR